MKKHLFLGFLAAFAAFTVVICGAFGAIAEENADVQEGTELYAGVYQYNEHIELGGQTIDSLWTLTLSDDGSYQMDTQIMGRPTTLTGVYQITDAISGLITTEAPVEGAPTMVVFFNDDGSCVWQLNADGSCEPTISGDGFPGGGMGGMSGAGLSIDADDANVSYASASPTQVLDIYLPESATGSDPLIVVVHGGGFKFGSQTMEIIEPIIKTGIHNGYVVASVDYRKSDEATFPGALSDVKAAVRFLRANADKYGIAPERIVVWGESAGAYLADMTALTPSVAALDDDVIENEQVSSAVSAVVSFYAPIEFYTMDEEFIALGNTASANHSQNSFETDYLGIPDMTADKEGVYRSWWGTYRDSVPTDLKAWIQAGTADTSVPCTQSEHLADGLVEVLGTDNVHFELIEGAEHEDAKFYTDENLAQVFAFLADALK